MDFGGSLSSDTITISYPTTATGYSGSLSGSDNPNQLEVTVARQVSNNFIKLLGGPATSRVGASAIAAIVTVTSPVPVLITHPSDKDVLSGNGKTSITICGGPSRSIQLNSSNTAAANSIPTNRPVACRSGRFRKLHHRNRCGHGRVWRPLVAVQ
jgi:hypothetical protein